MAAQDNRGEHDRFHAAAAQFQAHTSLPWSALPNVPYSILSGKGRQRSPQDGSTSFVDNNNNKAYAVQEQARDLNAWTERTLPFPSSTARQIRDIRRSLPELPVLPSPPLPDNTTSSPTPPLPQPSTSTYFGSHPLLNANVFSSRWSSSSSSSSPDHRQHKPALESQYLAKPSYSNSSNDSNINHRQERRSDHHWQCETMAESGFAPELQEHSPRSLSSDIHWWHSIQAVAAAVNEGAGDYNAEDQDLHLDQFRKDSMHDPMGQLHDVYRQFEKDPKLQTDMDKTTITTTTATTASSSRHTHLVFSNAGKRSHVLRQEMRTPIPNNFGGMSVGREWEEAGERQKLMYSGKRARAETPRQHQTTRMGGVTTSEPPGQPQSAGGVSTDHHSNSATSDNTTRLANTILAWTVPQSAYEDERLLPHSTSDKSDEKKGGEEENEEDEETEGEQEQEEEYDSDEQEEEEAIGNHHHHQRHHHQTSTTQRPEHEPLLKIPATRNIVNVASHSAAAEAQALALANLTGASPQRRPGRRFDEPERLKRPPNAYLLFNRDVRHQILAETPGLSVAEISKAISEQWSQLPQERKDYYNQEAEKIKQQHMKGHTNFIYCRRSKAELLQAGYKSKPAKKRKVPENDGSNRNDNSNDKATSAGRDPRGRKKKRLKHPKAPKHPMSAFLFYSKSVRSSVAARMPNASVGQVSKAISQQWRSMTDQERMPWEQKAKEDKARYAREMHSYTCKQTADQHQPPLSPVELDSLTIATVARMVNPKNQDACLLPPLYDNDSGHGEQFQILPATPPPS